jgi:hypothetical protein
MEAVSNSLLGDPWDKTVQLTTVQLTIEVQRLLDKERRSGSFWSEEDLLATLEVDQVSAFLHSSQLHFCSTAVRS